jgi:DNA repair protein RadC
MYEIMVCEKKNDPKKPGKRIKTLRTLFEISQHISDSTQEHILVVAVDRKYRLISARIVNIGTCSRSYVSLPDVFRFLLNDNAWGFYIVHNHPSHSLKISKKDKIMSDKLYELAWDLSIVLYDSVIVSEKGIRSIFSKRKLKLKGGKLK